MLARMADTNSSKIRRRASVAEAATIGCMKRIRINKFSALMFACALAAFCARNVRGQEANGTGALEFTAYVSPTAAKPEPVRQVTFYLLTKSFEEIKREIETKNAQPDREKFIADLKLSSELKEWIKSHDTMDLTMPGLYKQLTAYDILHVPEFLLAYQR